MSHNRIAGVQDCIQCRDSRDGLQMNNENPLSSVLFLQQYDGTL
jgi:hypothetical protein